MPPLLASCRARRLACPLATGPWLPAPPAARLPAALIKEVETAVVSMAALVVFQEGGSEEAADAAAHEEQQQLDEQLAAWAGGCPGPPPAPGRAAGRRVGAGGRPAAAALMPRRQARSGAGARAAGGAVQYRNITVQPGEVAVAITKQAACWAWGGFGWPHACTPSLRQQLPLLLAACAVPRVLPLAPSAPFAAFPAPPNRKPQASR